MNISHQYYSRKIHGKRYGYYAVAVDAFGQIHGRTSTVLPFGIFLCGLACFFGKLVAAVRERKQSEAPEGPNKVVSGPKTAAD